MSLLPTVVHEHLVRAFNFYCNGAIYKGMSYGGRLYRLKQTFEVTQRTKAFASACRLSKQGNQTVFTVSSEVYRVWIDMRSPETVRSFAA